MFLLLYETIVILSKFITFCGAMPDTKHRVAIAEVELIGKIKEWKIFIVWMLVRYGMY